MVKEVPNLEKQNKLTTNVFESHENRTCPPVFSPLQ